MNFNQETRIRIVQPGVYPTPDDHYPDVYAVYSFRIEEGVLFAFAEPMATGLIAVFAPGAWTRIEILGDE